MQNFSFYSPTYFSFGKDAENNAGTLVKRFGGTKVLIHYGGGSVVRSGLLDRVILSGLCEKGVVVFGSTKRTRPHLDVCVNSIRGKEKPL